MAFEKVKIEFTCNDCGYSAKWTFESPNTVPLPFAAITKTLKRMGWVIPKNGNLICNICKEVKGE